MRKQGLRVKSRFKHVNIVEHRGVLYYRGQYRKGKKNINGKRFPVSNPNAENLAKENIDYLINLYYICDNGRV